MTREQKIAKARRLRSEGMAIREIARQLEVPYYSTVYRWLNPESVRAANRAYCDAHRGNCDRCGAQTNHRNRSGICIARIKGDADLRRRTIQSMWMDGASLREIADTLGTTVNTVGVTMARMRADGWDLPLRHAMQNGRRVAA